MGIYSKKALLSCAIFLNVFYVDIAGAANWLMLQGVTDSPYPLTWGFLQTAYLRTSGTTLPAGPWKGQDAVVNMVQPDLSSAASFQIQRARLGVRGALTDNENISYFLLAEYGNNGITQPGAGGGKVTLTDASITFRQIEGAKIQVGQMKVPMSEELYQGIYFFNYINLTNIANQQLIERPFWTDGNANCLLAAAGPAPASNANYLRFCNKDYTDQFRSASVAARDVGVQIFDAFKTEGWEHSYAVLIGQGGANKDDRNDNLDKTLYWSSEKSFAEQEAYSPGYKLYAWRTNGKRTLYDSKLLSAGGVSLEAAEKNYDRNLMGVGATYFDGKYRLWTEYIKVDGMIFNGSTGGAVPGSVNGVAAGPISPGILVSQFKTEPEGEGEGGYLDFGYRIQPDIELDIRYDWYNRVTNLTTSPEFRFETWTVGAQYFFSRTSKAIVNYEKRSMDAVALPASSMENQIAAATDNRLSAQAMVLF